MVDETAPTLHSILGRMTVPQLRIIGGALTAVIAVSFSFGVFIGSWRTEHSVGEQVNMLRSELSQSKQDSEKLKLEKNFYAKKTEFLNYLTNYLTLPSNANTKSMFVDLICQLWKASGSAIWNARTAPLNLRRDQISIISPAAVDFLRNSGVLSEDLAAARGAVTVIRSPGTPEQAAETAAMHVQRQASGIRLEKVVHFSDGSNYTIPDEVAVEVHAKAECRPKVVKQD